jgi:hypothetical protein
LGGHEAPPPGTVPAKPKKDDKPQESTTARLLKAKRRAKQREDED